MAIESVDIIALLNRVRKPVPEVEDEGTAPAAAPPAAEAPPAETKAEPEPGSQPAPRAADMPATIDLAHLQAELVADETLLRRILGMLYRSKKENPNGGAVSILVMEKVLGLQREGAAFVMMYMKSKKIIEMDDKSRMSITVRGIDYLRAVYANSNSASEPVEEAAEESVEA